MLPGPRASHRATAISNTADKLPRSKNDSQENVLREFSVQGFHSATKTGYWVSLIACEFFVSPYFHAVWLLLPNYSRVSMTSDFLLRPVVLKIFGDRAVESHISPKTSEIWGTQVLLWGKVVRALMGLRPVFINPRTLVRTWGTQTELV
jgi:hypothetical protein